MMGLRMRFRPRSRIGHGLVALAPWLNIGLLFFMFALLNGQVLLQPVVRVTLPQGPLVSGERLGLVAVVVSVPDPETGASREMIFFDDERYLVDRPAQMEALRAALTAQGREHAGAPLVVQADAGVAHGTVVNLVSLAGEAGLREVCVAVRAGDAGEIP